MAALRGGAVGGDVWLPEAATSAAARNDAAFLKALAARGEKPAGPELIAIADPRGRALGARRTR